MDKTLQTAYQAVQKGQSYAFATIVKSTLDGTPCKPGAKMVVLSDGSIVGTIGGGKNEKEAVFHCRKAIKTGRPALVTFQNYGKNGQPICGGEMAVFIEPFVGTKHLVICGGGHIALPLSFIGKLLQFNVTVIDHRPEFVSAERFPHADKLIKNHPARALKKIKIDRNTFIVIVTPAHTYDFECLKTVVDSEAGYIGVIASHAKRTKFFEDLKKSGVLKKNIDRVKIPIGLNIGAQTPEEIAVSITSEMIMEYQKAFLKTKKFMKKTGVKNEKR